MKKMGLPDGAIRHKMMQDGISDDLMNEFFNSGNTIMKSKPVKKEPKEEKLPPLDEKIVGKYRKMKKMGLPDGAIQHKMVQDGIDQAIINQFFNIKTAKNKSKIDINNPIFDPYKKMKKAGLPPPVIKHKMTMDGRTQEEIQAFFGENATMTKERAALIAKKKQESKFKKLHWQALDESKLENSVWATKMDDEDDEDELDLENLKSLFGNSPKNKKKKKKRMSQM